MATGARTGAWPAPLRLGLGLIGMLGGCSGADRPVRPVEESELSCSIPVENIFAGARKDGIPALTDPELLPGNGSDDRYPELADRIIGAVVGGEAVAVPERVFWYHEVVNLSLGGASVSLTHCPLTGSSLGFDRNAIGDAAFGVSGLLYQNNLIMYDRSHGEESLWPQMLRGARCGDLTGTPLPMVPVVEMTWGGWLSLYPDSKVLGRNTGFSFDYDEYPYGGYSRLDSEQLLYPLSAAIDRRRPPKERALGIPDGSGGMVFPFGELTAAATTANADVAVVQGQTAGDDYVVLWDGLRQGGMAYRPDANGQPLTFQVTDNFVVDVETGSSWTVDGRATAGPLAGTALQPIAHAFVAYWFAWPAFYPNVAIWTAS